MLWCKIILYTWFNTHMFYSKTYIWKKKFLFFWLNEIRKRITIFFFFFLFVRCSFYIIFCIILTKWKILLLKSVKNSLALGSRLSDGLNPRAFSTVQLAVVFDRWIYDEFSFPNKLLPLKRLFHDVLPKLCELALRCIGYIFGDDGCCN